MDSVNLSKFDFKKAKGALLIVIIAVVILVIIIFGKDIINLFKSVFGSVSGAITSVTNPLGNTSNTQEITNSNQTITTQDTQTTVATNPFNSQLYTDNVGVYDSSLNDEAALAIAEQVKGSIGYFVSYAASALSALQGCQCQLDVSHVCQQYALNYSSNMWDDMSQGYDSSANKEILAQIATFANNLPLSL